ncbi:hypothetical protein [Yinghuangia seranimata]|uniref:hypothetical protein n=1 Tax=Yinghuangia seranimata TaxID=408067 RepID=UPI00248BA657|nr:hypothetical protein [Yinghuangia seranimata]MDI2132590.1 hypothetical protein [Yinghuangia seranimata]
MPKRIEDAGTNRKLIASVCGLVFILLGVGLFFANPTGEMAAVSLVAIVPGVVLALRAPGRG